MRPLLILTLSCAVLWPGGLTPAQPLEEDDDVIERLDRLRRQETEVLVELETSERELERRERALYEAEEGLDVLETRIAETETKLEHAQTRLQQLERTLRERLRALYRFGSSGKARVLLASDSLAERLRRQRMLRRIAEHDRRLFEQFLAEREHLEETRQRLTSDRDLLLVLRLELRSARGRAEHERSVRLRLLQGIQKERALAVRALVERERSREKLSSMMGGFEDVPATGVAFASMRGELTMPTRGVVENSFGVVRDDELDAEYLHSGVDLRAPLGTPVIAVHDGVVAYADWLHGYGRVVIIDHGDGYRTLAAHLEAVTVSVGRRLRGGQTIGRVGDSGSLRGAFLYFEIRHGPRPLDPMKWLRP